MKMWKGLVIVLGFMGAAWAYSTHDAQGGKQMDTRVFELRTYHAAPGKMAALHERFRKHTIKLLEKHGMTLIGFWSPTDSKEAEQTLIYLVAHPSEEVAKKNWKEFSKDPDWTTAQKASEKDGKLVLKVDRVFMKPTDYSAMK